MNRVAGIALPNSSFVREALPFVRGQYDDFLFNHVMRSWIFSLYRAQADKCAIDHDVLAASCLLHDLGLIFPFAGERRFEVEGADTAMHFIDSFNFSAVRKQLVWDSIALHTTPSIAIYKQPEVAYCAAGIGLDFRGSRYDSVPSDVMKAVLDAYPRLNAKRRFCDCFSAVARRKPQAAFGTILADFGERFVEGFSQPSLVDVLLNSPFAE